MTMQDRSTHRALALAPVALDVERRDDGTMILRCREPLDVPTQVVGDWLEHWAREAPERTFLAERGPGGEGWQGVSYAQALDRVRRIAQGLLDRGLGPERPMMVLSENSVNHGLLALAAGWIGAPVVPVSTAYSLMSSDHAKLRAIHALVQPGLVWASDPVRYGPALAAISATSASLDELLAAVPDARLDAAHRATGPDSTAKILFTSGSTGMPKGVINTQRMITANQQQAVRTWRFLDEEPPVVVDWLPWNHTFGGNFDFHLVLRHGGTMYIDAGKPMPGLIETTVRALKEISPTVYFNVPRGFDLLMPYLESDAQLRASFFARCRFVFYAGAALPQSLWERFDRMAREATRGGVALVSAWGSTETAPLATAVHFPITRSGVIGLPVPGCEVKLVPSGGKLEARVRGPNVTPGYFRRDDLTRDAFDDEGFYRIGDALRFEDPDDPERGLAFDGRVAEDFKLRTGVWVHVGALRLRLISAADPILQDAVITGHDRDEAGALLFLNPASCQGLTTLQVRERIAQALLALDRDGGGASSMRIARALVLDDPPRFDAGEITDKGYVNQRAVLDARAAQVARLHADPPDPAVITIGPARR